MPSQSFRTTAQNHTDQGDKYYLLSGRWSNIESANSENEPDYDVVKRKIHSTHAKEWNGMQMTLKKCENHFASVMLSHCVIAPPLSPPTSPLRSQLEIKTKIKTNILYANFCVHCRRSVSIPPPIRLFTFVHIFSQTSLLFFPSITKSFANLSSSLALCFTPVLPFSQNFYYYCFLLWFYFSRIGFANERRKKVLFVPQTPFKKREKWKRWKFYCKNVMTIENAMVMVPNALVEIISEYVCQLRARQI